MSRPLRYKSVLVLNREQLIAKLWPKVVWQSNGCWYWTGHNTKKGYGRISIERRADGRWNKVMAHRVAYELVKGKIPEGLDLDHLCRNRLCCHPCHLEPVTRKENIRRGLKVALKTHCIHGHAFDEKNTHVNKHGERVCRKCKLAYYYAKKGVR